MAARRSWSSFRNCQGFLAGEQLRDLLGAIIYARKAGRAIIWGIGGHVIKCGLAPVLVDLMDRGFLTGMAMNGSAAIHDFEVALSGRTSEDVERELASGRFGMARETGEQMNAAINAAAEESLGIGESLGRFIRVPPRATASVSLRRAERACRRLRA